MCLVFGDSEVVMSWHGRRTVLDKLRRSVCQFSEIKGNLVHRSACDLWLVAELKVAGFPTQCTVHAVTSLELNILCLVLWFLLCLSFVALSSIIILSCD